MTTETMMDWNVEDDDTKALARIAEMLVALAVLAESACGRSRRVRSLILWILSHAEAVARDFVVYEMVAADPATDRPALTRAGDGVADLMRLAVCFRALALAVLKLSALYRRFARRSTRRSTVLRLLAGLVLGLSNAPALAAPRPVDTS